MKFTFDPDKEASNIRKHGLDFSFAKPVFDDPLGVTVYDRFSKTASTVTTASAP